MKKLQKLFSALLSLALIVSLVPLTAFAKDDGTKGRNPNPKPRCTVTITYKLGNEGKNTALISGLPFGNPRTVNIPAEDARDGKANVSAYVDLTEYGYELIDKGQGQQLNVHLNKNNHADITFHYRKAQTTPVDPSENKTNAQFFLLLDGDVIPMENGTTQYSSLNYTSHDKLYGSVTGTANINNSAIDLSKETFTVSDLQEMFASVQNVITRDPTTSDIVKVANYNPYTQTILWYVSKIPGGDCCSYHVDGVILNNDMSYVALIYNDNVSDEAIAVPETVIYKIGTRANVDDGSTMTRKGYIFKGWGETPESTIPVSRSLMLNKTTTLYAIWEEEQEESSESSEPTSSEPTSSEPTSSEPTSSEPTSSEPTSSEPTSSEPTSSEPTSSEPTSSEPTSSEPTSSEPTSSEPTSSEPTSSEPTSSEPTSSEPTSSEPTSSEPTSSEPTSSEPTSSEPTSSEPTSSEPTSSEPTSSEPTSSEPTSSEPTSSEPTSSDEPTYPRRPSSSVPASEPAVEEEIPDEDTPLASGVPSDEPSAPAVKPEPAEIIEEDTIALTSAPKTGHAAGQAAAVAACASLLASVLFLTRKKK
ncbi:MAG: hypothetical protein PUC47_00800 [Oscillospiraceae bacterium]|nr:hypothetical protein [Oscillospiraceae bacterium]